MSADFSLLNIAFEATLFVLFLIRGSQMLHQYLIPALKRHQQGINEKWFGLQEQHAVLISHKKQLATQFLQQEKQIVLLSSKLETWYKMWEKKQEEKKKFFEKKNKALLKNRIEQENLIAQRRTASQVGRKVLEKTIATLASDPKLAKQYTGSALKKLAAAGKGQA